MKIAFTVKRNRRSATQGIATVCVNDIEVLTFGDTMELITEGNLYYGDKISGWASTKSDAEFIKAALFHPFDSMYHYSDKIKQVIDGMKE
ncbi:hypothetical protein BSK59_13115 [Paenibacillus odorifer]|uniref:hypothetical protein n=1 Tax=Paenibacillus odorifer TaxID=189426 RepID=UPI00096C9820|nr:hypothetical protein [Paenibacillus odorifer]OME55413.1 hypothetical protein BSK59_13115 [Paenibacillus odorifer]